MPPPTKVIGTSGRSCVAKKSAPRFVMVLEAPSDDDTRTMTTGSVAASTTSTPSNSANDFSSLRRYSCCNGLRNDIVNILPAHFLRPRETKIERDTKPKMVGPKVAGTVGCKDRSVPLYGLTTRGRKLSPSWPRDSRILHTLTLQQSA